MGRRQPSERCDVDDFFPRNRVLVIARAIVIATVRICNQYQRAAVFFLGRYSRRFLEWRRA
jgi:hypothetical protein